MPLCERFRIFWRNAVSFSPRVRWSMNNTKRGVNREAACLLYLWSYQPLKWAGDLGRYSDWLRAGWSGDRIPVGARFFAPVQKGWGPPNLLYNGYRVFSGGKERPGRDADPSPPSSAVVKKGYSYTSPPPMGRTACTEPQCLYKGALYLFIQYILRY